MVKVKQVFKRNEEAQEVSEVILADESTGEIQISLLGRRLKAAREAVGLTLTEAAKCLGFPSYQTLSKIEAGEREVKAAELAKFAKTYFCSINTLLGEKELKPAASLLWRKTPQGKERQRIETMILHLCEQYSLLETLLNLTEEKEFRLFDVKIGDIRTSGDIDTLADKTRSLLGPGSRPAFTLQKILEQNYGVKILYLPLSDGGSAASMVHQEFGAVVVINANEPPWRQNYDLAHELFHLITWKVVSQEDLENASFREEIEKKAERFASILLLPETEIKSELSKRLKIQKRIRLSDLVDIAREFGVSTAALLYRLANLRFIAWEDADELVKDEELRKLDRELRRRDWEEKPVSERFYHLAARCLRKGLISRGTFAEMVGIDRSDIDALMERFGLMETEGKPVEIIAP